MQKILSLSLLFLVACVAEFDTSVTSSEVVTLRDYTVPAVSTSAASPAGTLAGDMVITVVWSQGTVVPTHTLNAGYTQIQSRPVSDGTTSGRLSAAYRYASADGPVAETPYTIANATTGQTSTATLAYDGVWFVGVSSVATTSSSAPNPPSYGQGTMYGNWIVLGIGAWQIKNATSTVASISNLGGDGGYTLLTQTPSASHVTHMAIESREYLGLLNNTVDPNPFDDNVTSNSAAAMTIGLRDQ